MQLLDQTVISSTQNTARASLLIFIDQTVNITQKKQNSHFLRYRYITPYNMFMLQYTVLDP